MTARQTRERTLAMRQENQALLTRVRQHMLGPHEAGLTAEHQDVPVDAVTDSRSVPDARVDEPAATSWAGAPVLARTGQASVADRTLAALRVLLRSTHLAGPDDVPALVRTAAADLGAVRARLYWSTATRF